MSAYQGCEPASGIAGAFGVAEDEFDADPRHQLETRQLARAHFMGEIEKPGHLFETGEADKGRRLAFRGRHQLQHRRGDDAERAFRADEQVAQIVAGIVLPERPQAVPDAAIGEHHFEPEHEAARIAIGEHLQPAGIGREIAADLRRAFRGDAQGEQPPGLLGGFLRGGERHAGLGDHGIAARIDGADAVQPFEAQEDLGSETGSGRRRGRCCRPGGQRAVPVS